MFFQNNLTCKRLIFTDTDKKTICNTKELCIYFTAFYKQGTDFTD